MNITIVSSMAFPKEILNAKETLESLDHQVSIPENTYDCLEGKQDARSTEFVIKHDLLRKGFEKINSHDAIMVLNHEKNGIKGYVGSASLMEIAVAYFCKKKIFILNPLPDRSVMKNVDELILVQPTIINQDFTLVK